MKKIIIGLISTIFALHAADNVSIEQKQKIMFDQFRVATIPKSMSDVFLSLDAEQRQFVVVELESFLLPGDPKYQLTNEATKAAFYVVQRASPDTKIQLILNDISKIATHCIVNGWKLFLNKQTVKLWIQQSIKNAESQETVLHITPGIRQVCYAYQLQQKYKLPDPCQDYLDKWHQQKNLRNFELIKEAVFYGKPILVDPAPILPECLPRIIAEQEMKEFVKLYINASKEVLQEELLALD